MSRVRLGDLIDIITEHEDNPSQSKYDRFVGLEHYDAGEVVISRWGSTELLASAMKVFQPNDILVARRNVYLRRASVVNFAGLTSGDSIVIRAKDKDDEALLPFVLNTDSFWDFADRFADGTMSKRLSPKIMANFEFNMPSPDEKRRLAELLWAIHKTRVAYKELLQKTDDLVKSQFIEMFSSGQDGAEYRELKDCCDDVFGGKTPSMSHPEFYGGNIPFIKSGDVKDDTVSSGALWITDEAVQNAGVKLLPANTVIVVIRSAALRHEFHAAVTSNPVVINQDLKAFVPTDEFLPLYLMWSIKAHETTLLSKVQTVLTSHIEMSDLLKIPVMVASKDKQKQFCEFKEQADKSKFAAQQALESLTATQKALMKKHLA